MSLLYLWSCGFFKSAKLLGAPRTLVAPGLCAAQLIGCDATDCVQVLQLVAHLVYWGKASIIYPLCESNVYLLSPRCDTSRYSLTHSLQ